MGEAVGSVSKVPSRGVVLTSAPGQQGHGATSLVAAVTFNMAAAEARIYPVSVKYHTAFLL